MQTSRLVVSILVAGVLVAAACDRPAAPEPAQDAASGAVELPALPVGPIAVPDALPDVDIGHRSKAVDALLQQTILEGARLPPREALALEVRRFGEVCGLEDMRIGVRNFVENGPRAKAPFVHR